MDMSWNCDARLAEQDYTFQNERVAFRAGYSDAFHEAPMWAGNDRTWHPDEYRAGFDFGAADKALAIAEEFDEDEQTFSLETISAAIYKLRADYVTNGQYGSYQEINAGGCEDFATDIHELIGSPAENLEYQMIDPAYFLQPPLDGDDDNWGFPLNRDHLQAKWPSVVPPAGMDWDDLDHISAFGNFFSGTHIWIFSHGKHYDSEAPEGVDTPFDLPFFKRIIQMWIEEGKPEANPIPTPSM
jgi:hypothetical protein